MRKIGRNSRQGICCLIVCLLTINLFASDNEAINKGASWLANQQNEYNSWGTENKALVDTVEVFKTLHFLNKELDALNESLQFLAKIDETDTDKLARKLSVLSKTTANNASLIQTLINLQNEDGGFGLGESKQSSVSDTLLVIDALIKSKTDNITVLSKAKDYIISKQTEDGSWIYAEEAAKSDTARTALCMIALKEVELFGTGGSNLSSAVEKAKTYLESKRSGKSFGSIVDTALAYTALLKVKQPSELSDILNELTKIQNSNGSWNNDIYTTAVALRALGLVQPPVAENMADLSIVESGISFSPKAPFSGEVVKLAVTVFNNGKADAQDVTVEFFNEDPRLGGIAIGSTVNIPLIPSEGSAVAEVDYDTGTLVGPHQIVVFVDRTNVIHEEQEVNNAAVKILTIGGVPDLKINVDDITVSNGSPQAFEQIRITAKIHNIGNTPAENIVVRFLDNDVKIVDMNLSGVNAGSNNTATLITGFSEGNHTIKVVVDPDNLLTDEIIKTNNQAETTITSIPIPVSPADIIVESLTITPEAPLETDAIEIKVTIANIGGENIAIPFNVQLKQNSTVINTFNVSSLASGQKRTLVANINLAEGYSVISVNADFDNAITESSELNNSKTKSISVKSTDTDPDLVITEFSVIPDSINVGDTVQINVSIQNTGTTAAENVKLKIYNGVEQIGNNFNLSCLAGGQSQPIQLNTNFVSAGDKTLKVVIDPDNTVSETNESNNEAETVVTVNDVPKPDLAIISDSIAFSNDSPILGETVQVSVNIENKGTADAAPFKVLFTKGNPFIGGAILVDEIDCVAIPAGNNVSIYADYIPTLGSHDIFVLVDSGNDITDEISEKNNLANKAFKTGDIADLFVDANSISYSHTSLDDGLMVAVKARVDNIGSADAYNVTVQLAEKQGENLILIDSQVIDILAAGASQEVETIWQASPGNKTIKVIIDNDKTIHESNEDNNVAIKEKLFSISQMGMKFLRVSGDIEEETDTFLPYETLKIKPEVFLENIVTRVQITMPDSRTITPFNENEKYYYSISSNDPGDYKVAMRVIDNNTGALLETIEKSFTVLPLFKVGDINIKLSPTYLKLEDLQPVTIILVVQNKSNIDGNASAEITITDPGGNEVGNFAPTLNFEIGKQIITSLDPTEVFASAGIYTIQATITPEGTEQTPITFCKTFEVHPATRITASKELSPLLLEPIGDGKVHVKIDLAGVGTPDDITPIDLQLIIDVSGSMEDGGIEAARNAAEKFVDMLPENSRVGLVSFNSNSSLRFALSHDKESLKSTIRGLGAGGGTNIGSGINRARNHFNDVTPANRRRIAVLLSDGYTEDRSYALSEADYSAADNIVIYTIGLGSFMDEALMEHIALATKGLYYSSPTNEELEAVFVEVFEQAISLAAVNIKVKDTVNLKNIDLIQDSIQPKPHNIIISDNKAQLIWNFEKATIDDLFYIGFDVVLNNLKPGEQRLVNEALDIAFSTPDGTTALNYSIGEQFVSAGELGAINVNADKDIYNANDNAKLEVDIKLDGNKAEKFDKQSDWANGVFRNCSSIMRSGSLLLDDAGDGVGQNILINGDFETGDGTGWQGIGGPFCYINSYYRIAGSYSLSLYFEGFGSSTVSQTIRIPDEAVSASISFKDQCLYYYGTSDYQVLLKNTKGELLKTLFHKSNGNTWGVTERNFDISEFIGKTVKIIFTIDPDLDGWGHASFQVDDVELNIKNNNYSPTGTANYIIDAGHIVSWDKIIYDANIPEGTSIKFKTRSANTESDLGNVDFSEEFFTNRSNISAEPSRFLELAISMATDNVGITPSLDMLKVAYVDYSQDDKLELKTYIVDANGVFVEDLGLKTPNIEIGTNHIFKYDFNTANNRPGMYSAIGELYANGVKIAKGNDGFEIISETVEQVVNGSISVNKEFYTAGESVKVISTVKNDSPSVNLNNVKVKVEIMNSIETVVKTFNYTISNLLQGNLNQKDLYYPISSGAPDTYTVKQTVSIEENELFTRTTEFEVVSSISLGKGIEGVLGLQNEIVKRNVEGTVFYISAKNTGNVNLTAVTFNVEVINPETLEVVQSFSKTSDLAIGETYADNIAFNNITELPSSYPVTLNAVVSYNDEAITIPLDVNGFTVTNDAPIANAGSDRTIEGTSLTGMLISLDGAASTDANSTNPPEMDNDIVSYIWKEGEAVLGPGKTLQSTFKWGSHTVQLTVTDSVGATGTDEVIINIVDTTPPIISNLVPVNELITGNDKLPISATVTDTCSGVKADSINLKLDGNTIAAQFDTVTGNISYTPNASLINGWHELQLSASDNAGNTVTTDEWKFAVDTIAPVFSGHSPANNTIISNSTPGISVNVTDNLSGVDPDTISFIIDGTGVTPSYNTDSEKIIFTPNTALSDGNHQITVTAKDKVGNEQSITWNFIVDTTAPQLSELTPVNDQIIGNSKPEISIVATDNLSGVDFSTIIFTINNQSITSSYNATTGKVTYQPLYDLTDGWYYVVFEICDKVGNKSQVEWKFAIDTTKPTIAEMKPLNNIIISNNTPEISVILSDNLSGVDPATINMAVNGSSVTPAYNSATGKVAYTPSVAFADGWYSISLSVKDKIGNEAIAPEWKFAIDTTMPTITAMLPVNDTIIPDNKPEVSVIVNDSLSGIDTASIVMTVDGETVPSTYNAETGKVSYIPTVVLNDDWHNISVSVKDKVGNQATETWKFGVDVTAPVITDLIPEAGSIVNENRPEISATISDNFSGIDESTITLKIGEFTVPFTYDAATGKVTGIPTDQLLDGDYTIVLTVKDNVGNLGTTQSWAVKIQTWVIFHNSTSGRLDITGSSKQVNGRVHSNADIRIQGSNNDIAKLTTAVGSININGSGHDIPEQEANSIQQPIPVYDMNYYQQNANYTHSGTWHIKGKDTISAGIHFVNGDVKINANSVTSNCVIVATGDIRITGKAPNLTSSDTESHMLLFSGGDIHISGNNAFLKGIIYAPNGDIQITSSGETFEGAVIGNTVDISGSGITFNQWVD